MKKSELREIIKEEILKENADSNVIGLIKSAQTAANLLSQLTPKTISDMMGYVQNVKKDLIYWIDKVK